MATRTRGRLKSEIALSSDIDLRSRLQPALYADIRKTCRSRTCRREFWLTAMEQERSERTGSNVPSQCPECRNQRCNRLARCLDCRIKQVEAHVVAREAGVRSRCRRCIQLRSDPKMLLAEFQSGAP